jgi:hypothetical protein
MPFDPSKSFKTVFDPSKSFKKVPGFDPKKPFKTVGLVKDYVKTEPKPVTFEDVEKIVSSAIKALPTPRPVEKVIEKQIIKEIKEVEKKETKKYVEEKSLQELKQQLTQELKKENEQLKTSLTQSMIPLLMARGGSGVLGLPNPEGQGGKFLTTDGNKFSFGNVSTGISIGNPIVSGTSGSILFIDSSGNLAQDNSNLSYNSTSKVLSTAGFKLTTSPTNGYVLTSDGSGNGTWQAAPAASPAGSNTQIQFNDSNAFGGDAGLTYDKTNDKLTITGAADAVRLILRGCAPDSSNIAEWYNSSPTQVGRIGPDGGLGLNVFNFDYTNTAGAGSHIYMSNSHGFGQNVVSSFVNGLLVAKWRTDYVGNINWVAGTNGAHVFYTGGDYPTGTGKLTINNTGQVRVGTGTQNDSITGQFQVVSADASRIAQIVQGYTSQSAVLLQLQGVSSAQAREQVDIDTAWATSTDASRKARGIFRVWDTAAREAIRMEASGSAPMIGFFGHAANAQPSAYTVTNPTPTRSFDESAVSLSTLAQVVGTLIQDLQTLGLVA